jgi:hypothetical protein
MVTFVQTEGENVFAVDRVQGVAGVTDWLVESLVQVPLMLVAAVLMALIFLLSYISKQLPVLPVLNRVLGVTSILLVKLNEVDKVRSCCSWSHEVLLVVVHPQPHTQTYTHTSLL